jgi:hypothetical protein
MTDDRALLPELEPSRSAAIGTRGVKRRAARRPLPPDSIFLETIVSIYFFWVVQSCRFAMWLAGAE